MRVFKDEKIYVQKNNKNEEKKENSGENFGKIPHHFLGMKLQSICYAKSIAQFINNNNNKRHRKMEKGKHFPRRVQIAIINENI